MVSSIFFLDDWISDVLEQFTKKYRSSFVWDSMSVCHRVGYKVRYVYVGYYHAVSHRKI